MTTGTTAQSTGNEINIDFSGLWDQSRVGYSCRDGDFTYIKYSDGNRHYCLKFIESNYADKGSCSTIVFACAYFIDYNRQQLLPEPVERAIKISPIDITNPTKLNFLRKEYALKDTLTHLGIQSLVESQSYNTAYLIMNRQPGRSILHLVDKIKNQSNQTKLRICCEILRAFLRQFSEKKLIHLDIKPENIMMDGFSKPDDETQLEEPTAFNVNIIDCAFSRKRSDNSGGSVGSPGYIAPEIFDERTKSYVKCDAFSFARLFALFWVRRSDSYYLVVNGRPMTKPEMINHSIRCAFEAQSFLTFELFEQEKLTTATIASVYQILLAMLRKNPQTRMGIETALQKFEGLIDAKKNARTSAPNVSANRTSFFCQGQQAAASSSCSSSPAKTAPLVKSVA